MSELGRILVEARTAKELSLADVEKATRIRQKYLEGFEQGDYASLPRGAVACGFLRTYATYLGLDADDALQRYSQESGDTDDQTPIAEVGKPRLVDYRPVEVELLDAATWVGALGGGAGDCRRVGGGGLVVPGARWRHGLLSSRDAGFGAGAHVDQYPLGHAHPLDHHGDPDLVLFSGHRDRHADLRSADIAHADRPADDHTNPAAHCDARSGGADRVDRARRPARLGAGDRYDVVVLEGTLEPGQTPSWEANNSLKMLTGNAGGIEPILNGAEMGKMGNVGQVIERSWVVEQGQVNEQAPTTGTGTPAPTRALTQTPTRTPTPAG